MYPEGAEVVGAAGAIGNSSTEIHGPLAIAAELNDAEMTVRKTKIRIMSSLNEKGPTHASPFTTKLDLI